MRRLPLRSGKVVLPFCAVIAGAAGSWIWWARTNSGVPKPTPFCITDVLSTETIDGMQFQTVDVACDTLAKDETVRVYALAPHRSWLRGAQTTATLLFEYDPGEPGKAPQFASNRDGTITISVPSVSSVIQKSGEWQGREILYSIGHIDYP